MDRKTSLWLTGLAIYCKSEMEMDLGLKDRVAIVTASSKGLGRAVATGLAREGAKVVICARGEEQLTKTAEEIGSLTGSRVLSVRTDVTQHEEVKSLVKKVMEEFDRIDILVCNAGGPPPAEFLELSVEDWREGIELNLMSTIYLIREVVPHMKRREWGRIINMTSVAVKQPIDGLILSNVTRTAVAGLSKTVSNELARDNVLVNTVCPGYTLTKRVEELAKTRSIKEGVSTEEVFGMWERLIPMGRLGKPEEFANLVVFLASERASYITGVTIQVDGGYVKSIL